MTFIVFSGLPGSGKSTVARRLAPGLGLPLLDKDDFLDALFAERGVGDTEWRTSLSREADERFATAARQLRGACLVSWWRPRGAAARSGTPTEWLSTLSTPIVEVHCRCHVHTAVERFLTRQRHPGHLDSARTRPSLLTEFADLDGGPLGICPVVECDNEGEIDCDALLPSIWAAAVQISPSSTNNGK
jgi:hypothetical protein